MSAIRHMTKIQRSELQKALSDMKNGHHKTTAVKLEMEAQFNRTNTRRNGECGDCDGRGYQYCDCCDEGSNEHEHGDWCEDEHGNHCDEDYDTCGECNGNWRSECDTCNGSGYLENHGDDSYDWSDPTVCQDWLLAHVPARARKAVKFIRFYFDGTVDSECTVTVLIEYADVLLHFIDAWNALAEAIGNGMNTRRAGMHISLLNDPECRYACADANNTLNRDYVHNFREAMTPLLPALYFLASANSESRELGYRRPYIGPNKHGGDPYPAICTHDDTMFEFRVFEVCYDKPLMLIDFLIVMSKALNFYGPTPVDTSLKLGELAWRDGRGIERFYFTVKHLTALEKGLKWLKPDYKTIDQLKAERGFSITANYLREQHEERTKQWRSEYGALKGKRHAQRMAQYHRYLMEGYRSLADGYTEMNPTQYAKKSMKQWLENQGVRMKGGIREYVKQMAVEYERSGADYYINV